MCTDVNFHFILLFYFVFEKFACMHIYVHHVHTWCHRPPRTGVTNSCNPQEPCGCWKLNLSPLEELPVLLTTEPFLQPLDVNFLSDMLRFCIECLSQHLGMAANIGTSQVQIAKNMQFKAGWHLRVLAFYY